VIGVDTNVLARWVLRDVPHQAEIADKFFASLTPGNPGFVAQVSLVELFWVLTRSYEYSKTEALDVVEELLLSEELEFDEGEGAWRALLSARAGADFADALIADAFDVFGCVEAATFDRGASRGFGWRLLS
jgi:predicted nucleic-acid-binding protein